MNKEELKMEFFKELFENFPDLKIYDVIYDGNYVGQKIYLGKTDNALMTLRFEFKGIINKKLNVNMNIFDINEIGISCHTQRYNASSWITISDGIKYEDLHCYPRIQHKNRILKWLKSYE